MDSTILAKSGAGGKEVTLPEHSKKVCEATVALFGSLDKPTRLSSEWLRFFKLPNDVFSTFLMCVLASAALHDIGKANDGFLAEMRGKRESQVIRHEHLSGILLHEPEIRQWLESIPDIDVDVVTSAVVSHHLKVTQESFAVPLSDRSGFRVLVGAEGFSGTFDLAAVFLASSPPVLPRMREMRISDSLDELREDLLRQMHRFERTLKTDAKRRRLLLAVRAGLIAADSAGSGVSRLGYSSEALRDWISKAFLHVLTSDDIETKIITPRVTQITKHRRNFEFHDFQIVASTLGSRALLLSGCGTGKTLAAWKWIKEQVDRRPAGKVLFLYPTRATSTEGFRDYVSWAGQEEAALLHGTSKYDIEEMFGNPGDPRFGGDYTVNERLFALGYWHKRVFSATVDSFLSFMQHKYGSMCLLPVLADSIVVIDEIHSFDDSMFRTLLYFLRSFDLPVLCMTASLPEQRKDDLVSCGLEVFPKDDDVYPDLKQQSAAPRYHVEVIEPHQARSIVLSCLGKGQKVLWIVNTVSRCQDTAVNITPDIPINTLALCYHSRFRLQDRHGIHERLIKIFREHKGAALVVTTQVCEMSLDLDADVIITEAAPVPSLIQRMGRCCREPIPRPGRIGQVYVYRPEKPQPYECQDVEDGYCFSEKMAQSGCCSHADLSEYLAQMSGRDRFTVEGYTSFLHSGWTACSKEQTFREGEDFTVDCLLDFDVEDYLEIKNRGGSGEGFVIPVPKKYARPNPRLGRYLSEASGKHYDPEYGFMSEVIVCES